MKGLAVRKQSLAVATLVALACTACSGEPTDPYAADTEPFKALPKTIEFRKWLDEQGEPWKGITKVSSTAPDAATIRVNEPYDNEEGAERLIRLWGEYSGTNPSDLNVSIFDNDTGFIYANSVAD
ncbi:hypothetical protein ACFU6M_33045 [Streptomyces bottropensis]|jgi:hypothetical protein|uniref:hypothetical protein n=1 Tax=Streptomyces bottropensis TaxID=42235 RepID=UPI003677D9D2